MSREVRRTIPLYLIMGLCAFFLLEYFADISAITGVKSEITRWGTIVSGFMLIFGVVLLIRHHFMQLAVRNVGQREKILSVVFFVSFLAFLLIGFSTPERTGGTNYQWIYQNMYRPAGTAITALCFWWCIYGGYKTFTIRSWESASIGAGAVIYMLRLLPIGPVFVPPLAPLADWLLATINVGATRGGTLAVGAGSLVLGMRTLLGKETGALEAVQEG
ncbi:MAG: hypothetical protein JSV27_07275 [Candidatus Bathyarchaeota archaeon]|nr:MAG: hypothetical protein JSV27_07275 [Candidatus Bathyarchaeota archaeon]